MRDVIVPGEVPARLRVAIPDERESPALGVPQIGFEPLKLLGVLGGGGQLTVRPQVIAQDAEFKADLVKGFHFGLVSFAVFPQCGQNHSAPL